MAALSRAISKNILFSHLDENECRQVSSAFFLASYWWSEFVLTVGRNSIVEHVTNLFFVAFIDLSYISVVISPICQEAPQMDVHESS